MFVMNEERYKKLMTFWERHQTAANVVVWTNKTIPPVFAAALAMLIWISRFDILTALPFFLTQALCFLLLTLFRKWLNKPRPCEVYDFTPLINSGKKGRSFPSRHTYSAFVITINFIALATVLPHFLAVAAVMFILSAALGICRILAGVHFISDVVVGAIFALLTIFFAFLSLMLFFPI